MANPQPENGTTNIANELMDMFCRFRIPGELRQILDAIIRKTYGWHKREDWISHTQIIRMTGLLKGNVSRGLSKLITHKLVIKSDNKLRLNKNYDEWVSFKKLSKVITKRKLSKLITGVIKTDTKVIKSEGNKNNYTKETITNTPQAECVLYFSSVFEKRFHKPYKPFRTDFINIAELLKTFDSAKLKTYIDWYIYWDSWQTKSGWTIGKFYRYINDITSSASPYKY